MTIIATPCLACVTGHGVHVPGCASSLARDLGQMKTSQEPCSCPDAQHGRAHREARESVHEAQEMAARDMERRTVGDGARESLGGTSISSLGAYVKNSYGLAQGAREKTFTRADVLLVINAQMATTGPGSGAMALNHLRIVFERME